MIKIDGKQLIMKNRNKKKKNEKNEKINKNFLQNLILYKQSKLVILSKKIGILQLLFYSKLQSFKIFNSEKIIKIEKFMQFFRIIIHSFQKNQKSNLYFQ